MCGCAMVGDGLMGWGLGMVFMVVFWGLVVWGAIMLLRTWSGGPSTAEQELGRRFASGEISDEEYRERRSVLSEERTGRRWRA